jgi:hypothetical protein
MENCMTFSHEHSGMEVGDEYWQIGSMARRQKYYDTLRLKAIKNATAT